MKLVVGYLATPGGADAMALAVRLARTLDAEIDACMILPYDSALPKLVAAGGGEGLLSEQAEKWLAEALASVPEGVAARSHARFDDSFADGLLREAARLEADMVVVGGSGGGLAGSYSLGSVVNELLHSSPVPVAVAPRRARDSAVERVREGTRAVGRGE